MRKHETSAYLHPSCGPECMGCRELDLQDRPMRKRKRQGTLMCRFPSCGRMFSGTKSRDEHERTLHGGWKPSASRPPLPASDIPANGMDFESAVFGQPMNAPQPTLIASPFQFSPVHTPETPHGAFMHSIPSAPSSSSFFIQPQPIPCWTESGELFTVIFALSESTFHVTAVCANSPIEVYEIAKDASDYEPSELMYLILEKGLTVKRMDRALSLKLPVLRPLQLLPVVSVFFDTPRDQEQYLNEVNVPSEPAEDVDLLEDYSLPTFTYPGPVSVPEESEDSGGGGPVFRPC